MILIADSGSTKTSWCYISADNKKEYFSTSGINPYFRTTKNIVSELEQDLVPGIKGVVKRIYFYGAGIINKEIGQVVKSALSQLFPEAVSDVQSDLLAAAHSTLKNESGIPCILGTGSNSCLYDGKQIIEHIPPLGFILGDEGSGAVLGKKILADFLKGIMPQKLATKFKEDYKYQYSDYLQYVYKTEKPNKFLADLVPFIKENIENEYCSNLVENSFEGFLERNISQYSNYRKQKICFVGSIAFHFQDQLKKVLSTNNLIAGIILKDPMEGLIQFHFENKTFI